VSRYRLTPTPTQAAALRDHCAHARFVWNLAVEQQAWWRLGRRHAPGWAERSRQLTEARAEFAWLRGGSRTVQEQALRDFEIAMRGFFAGTNRIPGFRKAGRNEGFCVQGQIGQAWDVRRLSRHVGEVLIPKIGWVRFRWSRDVPQAKSYRVTLDRAGRWHVAFTAVPPPLPAPGTGEVIGVDRGVAVSVALSTGETYQAPVPSRRAERLHRRLSRAKRGSNRRMRAKARLAKVRAHDADRRKDWAEKTSTDIARRFDVIRIEDLKIRNMTRSAKGTVVGPGRKVRQKAGLNRAILASGWGLLVRRLDQKAPGRVEKINPAFTSQRCSACGHVSAENRKSQAVFACIACNFACNADVNAAINIAAGHAVTARGGSGKLSRPVNREPQIAVA
jgi:putative transposase